MNTLRHPFIKTLVSLFLLVSFQKLEAYNLCPCGLVTVRDRGCGLEPSKIHSSWPLCSYRYGIDVATMYLC